MTLREVRARLGSHNNQQGRVTGKEETKDQSQVFFSHLFSTELLASLGNRGSYIPFTEKEVAESLRNLTDATRWQL